MRHCAKLYHATLTAFLVMAGSAGAVVADPLADAKLSAELGALRAKLIEATHRSESFGAERRQMAIEPR